MGRASPPLTPHRPTTGPSGGPPRSVSTQALGHQISGGTSHMPQVKAIFSSETHYFFKHLFQSFEWLATLLRACEHSPLLRDILHQTVLKVSELQTVNDSLFVPFSVAQILESKTIRDKVQKTHLTPQIRKSKSQINISKLKFHNSKIMNSYVLRELTAWVQCTSVDLSYTNVTDKDIFRYAFPPSPIPIHLSPTSPFFPLATHSKSLFPSHSSFWARPARLPFLGSLSPDPSILLPFLKGAKV